MALIALRIKAEIPNITYLFTLLLTLHSFSFSEFWTYCSPFSFLNVTVLGHRSFINADLSTWCFDSFLPTESSHISAQEWCFWTPQSTSAPPTKYWFFILSHSFHYSVMIHSTYDSVASICFSNTVWAPSRQGFVWFVFLLFVSSDWHIICSQWINEWTDQVK